MKKVILITGASSGFGRLMANALAAVGHTVYASMRGLNGKNAGQVGEIAAYAEQHKVDLRPFRVVVDPASDGSAVAFSVIDRVREEFLHRIGLADLLRPTGKFFPAP